MRIAIVGCRPPSSLATDADHQLYRRIIADVIEFVGRLPLDSVIVSGGAVGVDRTAATSSKGRLDLVEHLPDYDRYPGHVAPLERNTLIVRDADEVHAWPAPWSRGTWDTIRKSRRAGKPTYVHEPGCSATPKGGKADG